MSRSQWKGPYFKNADLKTNVKTKIITKNSTIIPKLVGNTAKVYSGRKFIKISITEEMIGHKVGEFTPTRERFEFKKKKKKN
uniref:ribosomal protein S19 n=1 Tax=Nitzschia dissipata TaxID=303402 RepID=UPI0020293F35|nr:ribosomal protein S19 [Nitzschia dissipata]QYB23058.1 ribosomal protein S19 [Nitzschia dissipata]